MFENKNDVKNRTSSLKKCFIMDTTYMDWIPTKKLSQEDLNA